MGAVRSLEGVGGVGHAIRDFWPLHSKERSRVKKIRPTLAAKFEASNGGKPVMGDSRFENGNSESARVAVAVLALTCNSTASDAYSTMLQWNSELFQGNSKTRLS